MTLLVTYGSSVATISAKYAPERHAQGHQPLSMLAAPTVNPANTAAAAPTVGEIAKAERASPAVATSKLAAISGVP